ncbi:MAG: CoA transferase, partial [Gammaproteobacteria bacterium]|nr:CoA transferase [Gammaproteobacteria bacterium]
MAAPAVAMMLADLGALVIHVDPPNGPLWDSPANAILQRNKQLVNVDLKSTEGLEAALALIEEADILIEGFRPGVMQRLGIDFASLRQNQPDLITLSMPGFASDDELRRDWRAFESVIAASSGVFSDMGLNRILMGVNPSFSPLPLGSSYATVIAAASVVLALFSRAKTGIGDQIEVPLASALMEGLGYNSLHIENGPERYKTLRQQEIERRRIEGLPMNVSYDALQEFLDPFFRNYKCKDGRMFYVVCPSHKGHVRRCLETLGLYEDLVAEGFADQLDVYTSSREWAHDVSLGLYPLPREWADHIAERMKAVFLTRTTKEW